YFTNASTCIKDGYHDAPVHDASNNAVVAYWQHLHVIALPPASVPSPCRITTPRKFTVNKNELTVYLNRMKLELDVDYSEVSETEIDLKPDPPVVEGDKVWVMRTPSASPQKEVPNWVSFAPGYNCHDHYGGIRGCSRNPELCAGFSERAGGSEPILGK